MRNFILIIVIVLFGLSVSPALAKVGVGVNLGKIDIDEPLAPGGTYNFPAISVLNTGDEAGTYELSVSYHEDQEGMRPPQEWFTFSPSLFDLAAGGSQPVSVKVVLPVNAEPGDYFALLEAHPVVEAQGGTTIGIAAATKASFTVGPSSLSQAFLRKVSDFFRNSQPWSTIVLVLAALAIVLTFLRKFFSFNIAVRKKQ